MASAEEAASAILEALFFGKFAAPTTIEEIAQLCPRVWKRAVRVFAGNEADARDWMDSPCPLLGDEPPLLVASRVGGSRPVLWVLAKMDRQARRRQATVSEYYKSPLDVSAPPGQVDKVKTKRQYAQALARIDTLKGAKADTAEGHELVRLIRRVEDYEKRTFGP